MKTLAPAPAPAPALALAPGLALPLAPAALTPGPAPVLAPAALAPHSPSSHLATGLHPLREASCGHRPREPPISTPLNLSQNQARYHANHAGWRCRDGCRVQNQGAPERRRQDFEERTLQALPCYSHFRIQDV
ncbi:hypothetical protein B0O80DRAFT_438048 [Mortierella sp. GBAus27b]|nr:hypothetical protein B0O80DRAFT_438048 [Mortierella sp. GBAus27b]